MATSSLAEPGDDDGSLEAAAGIDAVDARAQRDFRRLRLRMADHFAQLRAGIARAQHPAGRGLVFVASDDWPRLSTVAGRVFRSMLPSGFHCETCHGLVPVLEAYAGADRFERAGVEALLSAHVELLCRGGRS